MALPFPFNPNQTDAKSPIDEQLMDENYRQNIEYLDTVTGGGAAATMQFRVHGDLTELLLDEDIENGRRIDGGIVTSETTFTKAKLYLKKRGASGVAEVNVRRLKKLNHIIESIASKYTALTQSVTRAGSAILTQSVTKATPDVATQSVAFLEATININSIVLQNETSDVRINLAGSLLDSAKYLVDKRILISGATNPANNGSFPIKEINRDGDVNIIIVNGSAVNQTAAAGTIQLQLMVYNLTLAASAEFVAGELARFSGHTSAQNDGDFEIYGINQGGNNVAVYNSNTAPVAQAGVAGTTANLRWLYTYLSAVPTPDFTVGEHFKASAHTSSANDNAAFTILALNQGGNNIKIYNVNGVVQAGVAGQAESNRFIYAMPTDPTTDNAVGQKIKASTHTNSSNDGIFEIKQLNRLAVNNIVVLNSLGINQAGVAGSVRNTRTKYTFASDLSAFYQTAAPASIVDIINCANEENSGQFTVLEENYGGFNIVVDNEESIDQSNPCGQVLAESREIFSTNPSLTTTEDFQQSTNAVFHAGSIPADSVITMDVLQVPTSDALFIPTDLTLTLS